MSMEMFGKRYSKIKELNGEIANSMVQAYYLSGQKVSFFEFSLEYLSYFEQGLKAVDKFNSLDENDEVISSSRLHR